MVADRLTQAVRHQLGMGRLLPLGEADDGSWLTEEAARAVLRTAVTRAAPRVRLDSLRIAPASTTRTAAPSVPPPPSALPPGPLLVTAEFAVPVDEPLPVVADALRQTLLDVAERELGLRVAAVDLRVTDLLDSDAQPPAEDARPAKDDQNGTGPGTGTGLTGPAAAVAAAVTAVPGVARLAPVLGSPLTAGAGGADARAVRITDSEPDSPGYGSENGDRGGDGSGASGGDADGTAESLGPRAGHPSHPSRPSRHVLLQLAVSPGHRVLDTARAARTAATAAAAPDATRPDRTWLDARAPGAAVTVAVLVTAVDAG